MQKQRASAAATVTAVTSLSEKVRHLVSEIATSPRPVFHFTGKRSCNITVFARYSDLVTLYRAV